MWLQWHLLLTQVSRTGNGILSLIAKQFWWQPRLQSSTYWLPVGILDANAIATVGLESISAGTSVPSSPGIGLRRSWLSSSIISSSDSDSWASVKSSFKNLISSVELLSSYWSYIMPLLLSMCLMQWHFGARQVKKIISAAVVSFYPAKHWLAHP